MLFQKEKYNLLLDHTELCFRLEKHKTVSINFQNVTTNWFSSDSRNSFISSVNGFPSRFSLCSDFILARSSKSSSEKKNIPYIHIGQYRLNIHNIRYTHTKLALLPTKLLYYLSFRIQNLTSTST